MGAVKREIRCSLSVGGVVVEVGGVVVDPQQDWSCCIQLSGHNLTGKNLRASAVFSSPISKTESREVSSAESVERRAFFVPVDEMEDVEEGREEEAHDHCLFAGTRIFTKGRLEAANKRAEEEKAAAVEANRKAAKEAAEKVATQESARTLAAAAVVAPKEVTRCQTGGNLEILNDRSHEPGFDRVRQVQSAGNVVKGADIALKFRKIRQQIYREVAFKNQALGSGSSSDCLSHGLKIQRLIKQISGMKENLRLSTNV